MNLDGKSTEARDLVTRRPVRTLRNPPELGGTTQLGVDLASKRSMELSCWKPGSGRFEVAAVDPQPMVPSRVGLSDDLDVVANPWSHRRCVGRRGIAAPRAPGLVCRSSGRTWRRSRVMRPGMTTRGQPARLGAVVSVTWLLVPSLLS